MEGKLQEKFALLQQMKRVTVLVMPWFGFLALFLVPADPGSPTRCALF